MEKTSSMKVMITAFVVLILAIAFLTSIADQTSTVTSKENIADETTNLATSCYASGLVNESNSDCNITVTNYPTSWRIEDCPLDDVVVSNATGTLLTLDTDYHLFASSGIVQMLNTAETNSTNLGNVLVDYSYCGDSYMNSSWGRTILGTNVGIYALAVLIIIIAAAYLLLNRKED